MEEKGAELYLLCGKAGDFYELITIGSYKCCVASAVEHREDERYNFFVLMRAQTVLVW